MSTWRINTTEDYDVVDAYQIIVQPDGWLLATDTRGRVIGGWTTGFWLSYIKETDDQPQDDLP